MCLSAIFDHSQVVTLRDLHQRIHIDRMPVDVNGQNRPGACGQHTPDPCHVHRVVNGIDVDKDRRGAHLADRLERGSEGMGRRNDFIARTDSSGQQRQRKRVCPVACPDAVTNTVVRRKGLLESLYLRSQHERPGIHHALNRLIDLRLERSVL